MPAPELDLVAAVERAQAGDQAAFDLLYNRFADPLYRYVAGYCGSAAVAEDLTGDLWLRVVERLPSFRFPHGSPEAAFSAWLYRIARNLAIDASRRRGNYNAQLAEEIESDGRAPDEAVIMGEEYAELRAALHALTPEQRTVVLLRFVEERSNAEVARVMEKSEGAVKVMQHRALATLARVLGGQRIPRTQRKRSEHE